MAKSNPLALAISVPNGALPQFQYTPEVRRKPAGVARYAQKVLGIKSLTHFLAITQRQLGQLLAHYVGKVYTRSAISTWAMYEDRKKMPRKYAMSSKVVIGLHQLFRDFIRWATNGRYTACVRGAYHWNVKVVRA